MAGRRGLTLASIRRGGAVLGGHPALIMRSKSRPERPPVRAELGPGTKNAEYAPGAIMAFRAWTRGRTTLKTFTTTMAAVALGAFGLIGAAQAQDKGTVGVAMPTKSSARWIDDGNNMVKVLKEKGYNV